MNHWEKFLSHIGISQERFEKMSDAEQGNLTAMSTRIETAEYAQSTAEASLATATERVSELEASLATSQEGADAVQATLTETETNLATATARIAELEASVSNLTTKLSKTPGAADTKVITGEEKQPDGKAKKLRSWEVRPS